jgi:hypothetical protein
MDGARGLCGAADPPRPACRGPPSGAASGLRWLADAAGSGFPHGDLGRHRWELAAASPARLHHRDSDHPMLGVCAVMVIEQAASSGIIPSLAWDRRNDPSAG